VGALASFPVLVLAETAPDRKAAVDRAVPVLQKAGEGYIRQRGCFSCHHQALPVLALGAARERGFVVDAAALKAQVDHTEADLRGNVASYRTGQGQGGGIVRAGYSLWTLSAAAWMADETTAAVTTWVVGRDSDQGFWRSNSDRPPSEASNFTSTFLALQSLQVYPPADPAAADARRARARDWLLATPAKDTEDRVFRLWGLKLAGAEAIEVHKAGKELRDAQREDGGWSQLPELESDAYATGSALVALSQAGELTPQDAGYRKGISYLLRTQQEDGSWHVVTRSKPFQPYFESGFPYGKDQWISCAATSWAVWALVLPDAKR
jgi:hypothetical protein